MTPRGKEVRQRCLGRSSSTKGGAAPKWRPKKEPVSVTPPPAQPASNFGVEMQPAPVVPQGVVLEGVPMGQAVGQAAPAYPSAYPAAPLANV